MHPNYLNVLNTSHMPENSSEFFAFINVSITQFCEIVSAQGISSESTYDFAQGDLDS